MIEVLTLVAVMLAAGCVAGLTTGLFGVGGGFIIVPTLLVVLPYFPGDPAQHIYIAIGTSLASIVVSSARAVQAHAKDHMVDFDILIDWAPWLTLGVLSGVAIASVTESRTLLLVFASGVLVYSLYFLFPSLFPTRRRSFVIPNGAGRAALASGLGGFSALLGIGGGTPFVLTMLVCGRPVHQATETASGVGFIIAMPGAIGFAILGWQTTDLPTGSLGFVNLPALIAICATSIFAAPLGARVARKLNEVNLKRSFGVYLVIISMAMFHKLLGS